MSSTLNELLTGSQEVARISQHLVDGRSRTIHQCRTVPDKKGERESTGCSTGQHGTKPTQQRCAGASLQELGHITHFRCRQSSEERGSFLGEASSNLSREHNQTSPASVANQLWATRLFSTSCNTLPCQRADQGRVGLLVVLLGRGAVRQPRPRAS